MMSFCMCFFFFFFNFFNSKLKKIWKKKKKTLRVIPLLWVLSCQLHQVFHRQILVRLAIHATFDYQKPCYFNIGVMVIYLDRWRWVGYMEQTEKWMEIQKSHRIYELGSLPPFLLVFAGHVGPIEHRWNQHGLGGNNVKGSCRDLHLGLVN